MADFNVGDIVTYKLTNEQRILFGGNHFESFGELYAYCPAIVVRVNGDGTSTGSTVNLRVLGDGNGLDLYVTIVPITGNTSGAVSSSKIKPPPKFNSIQPYENSAAVAID